MPSISPPLAPATAGTPLVRVSMAIPGVNMSYDYETNDARALAPLEGDAASDRSYVCTQAEERDEGSFAQNGQTVREIAAVRGRQSMRAIADARRRSSVVADHNSADDGFAESDM